MAKLYARYGEENVYPNFTDPKEYIKYFEPDNPNYLYPSFKNYVKFRSDRLYELNRKLVNTNINKLNLINSMTNDTQNTIKIFKKYAKKYPKETADWADLERYGILGVEGNRHNRNTEKWFPKFTKEVKEMYDHRVPYSPVDDIINDDE